MRSGAGDLGISSLDDEIRESGEVRQLKEKSFQLLGGTVSIFIYFYFGGFFTGLWGSGPGFGTSVDEVSVRLSEVRSLWPPA